MCEKQDRAEIKRSRASGRSAGALLAVSGWINHHQQSVLEYLQAENRASRQQLGPKRIRWTDAQRRLLAEKARAVGRAALAELGPVVTPDIGNRRVHIAGITNQPSEAWMKQIARNLTDCVDGFLARTRYLIMDRDLTPWRKATRAPSERCWSLRA